MPRIHAPNLRLTSPEPQTQRPEVAHAELERARRALENWGASHSGTQSAEACFLPFDDVRELYLSAIQLLERRQTWPAEHLGRALQHLALAGWHHSRITWRTAGPPLPPSHLSPRRMDELRREIEQQEREAESFLSALHDRSSEATEPSLTLPLLQLLLEAAQRQWALVDEQKRKPRLLKIQTEFLHFEQSHDRLQMILEISQGIHCLRLAYRALQSVALDGQSRRKPKGMLQTNS
jgi:hypothetical protein